MRTLVRPNRRERFGKSEVSPLGEAQGRAEERRDSAADARTVVRPEGVSNLAQPNCESIPLQ
jgi:hypothetical protein